MKGNKSGALIACSSALVMVLMGWFLLTQVESQSKPDSILTTTGQLAAYERLYRYAEQQRNTTTNYEYRVRFLHVQVMILDAIAEEPD